MNHLQARKMQEPVTPDAVSRIGRDLIRSIEESERSIAMAEAAADALAPIAHYVKTDVRAARCIMEACPGVKVRFSRDELGRDGPGLFVKLHTHSGNSYAYICVRLSGSACTVADCIDALRECASERERLARLRAQFEKMEEIVDTEERIRGLAREIERLRRETALAIVGDSYPMYHDAIREECPGLAGRR